MKLKTRLTFLTASLALIPLSFALYLGYTATRAIILKQTIQQLVLVADIQKNRVNEKLEGYLEQIKSVSSRTQLRVSVAQYAQTTEPEDAARITKIITDATSAITGISDISILDTEGIIIASTDPSVVGENHATAPFFLRGKKVHALHDVFNDAQNIIHAQLVGPLVLEGEVIGVMNLTASAGPLLTVTEDYSGLGDTGEVIFAKKNTAGDSLFLAPLRFNTSAALRTAVPKDAIHTPMISAVNGIETIFIDSETTDYRGESVFAVTRYIESLNWGLVAKIDRSEVFHSIDEFTKTNISVMGLSTTLIILMSFFVAKAIVRPILSLTYVSGRVQKGIFTDTVIPENEDEIGHLARAFNTMIRRIQELYGGLEQEVAEKTQDLQKALHVQEEQNKNLEDTKRAVLNILEDLEDEKAKLTDAKARDEAILGGIGDGLVVTDKDRKVTYMNTVAQKQLGCTDQSYLGALWPDIVAPVDEKNKPISKEMLPVTQALQKGTIVSSQAQAPISFTTLQKTIFPVSVTASPITSTAGVLGAVVVFRDVTKERQIDQAKTEFVSLASHQLRTPLSTINWYAEMLLAGDAGKITEDQKKYLEEIYIGNQRMVGLVNALLNVSRLELGTFMVEPEPTNIVKIAQSVVQEMEPDIFKKQLGVTEEYDPSIPTMKVDPKLFRIVLQNLISNAVKYTPEKGSVVISMKVVKQSDIEVAHRLKKYEKGLLVEVRDTGLGIPAVQQDKIFSKLFRADNVKASDTQGTGLGLYILKSIIEYSGGSVWFVSEENKGTSFFVNIPFSGMKAKEGTRSLGD